MKKSNVKKVKEKKLPTDIKQDKKLIKDMVKKGCMK